MTQDKRMLLIRNLQRAAEDAESVTIEYQVFADAHIVGAMEYGPYYFIIWEITNKPSGEERLLCLRVTQLPAWKDESWKTASKSGYFHGGGIASELVALASLFLRRRLKLGPETRVGNQPSMITVEKAWKDKELIHGSSNLESLREGLELARGLDDSLHQSFILAARLYQQALELVEVRPDWAYLNLVSAVETLLPHHEPTMKQSLKNWDSELAGLTAQIPDAKLREAIEDRILEGKFVARRFVDFVVTHTEPTFWELPNRPASGEIKPDELPELLRRIYKQRSRTLHDGEPFPPYACEPPLMNEEVPRHMITIGERKWEASECIPNVQFFERLVNHVLLNFLRRHQAG